MSPAVPLRVRAFSCPRCGDFMLIPDQPRPYRVLCGCPSLAMLPGLAPSDRVHPPVIMTEVHVSGGALAVVPFDWSTL